ncbi:LON peptidase substrate-binding domain-containing protein [Leptothrix discophora]|uniref:LON peptidase substrate-binding domain-containing protein n=1 Tax=Leptothrix discophora TaxID=89 RepID=A0ABT9G569_LEPDI|nr:LON peptidase substrate-binding domain-containing protein [Leptothrix discophora]MDP4301353.1 LON peptidase substrate-binding domain-containing protein [Leptothrix discophora]
MNTSPPAPDLPLHALPLFPLGTVLFPDGVLALKVFEARYLDLMGWCLREGRGFGVVTLIQGGEVRDEGRGEARGKGRDPVRFEAVGCLASIAECDADQPGILMVRCHGGRRFELDGASQRPDGLWVAARATLLSADEPAAPLPEHAGAVAALQRAVIALDERGDAPFKLPLRYDDAGWVANRWCEILPIPLATRHKLMALQDPVARLGLVDGFLRRHKIV